MQDTKICVCGLCPLCLSGRIQNVVLVSSPIIKDLCSCVLHLKTGNAAKSVLESAELFESVAMSASNELINALNILQHAEPGSDNDIVWSAIPTLETAHITTMALAESFLKSGCHSRSA